MATPLPPNPFSNATIAREASNKYLDLERRHEQVRQEGRLSVLVCARFLGHLLLEAPTESGHDKVASKIMRLSGATDSSSIDAKLVEYDEGEATNVEVARLIRCAANKNQAGTISSIQAIFGEYGGLDEADLSDVHNLRNILSVGSRLFHPLTHLQVWLERDPADPPNVYKPAAVIPQYLNGVLQRIEFTTPDPSTFSVPDARYLAVHTACARSAHFSGVAEHVRKILYSLEETDTLPASGSSDMLYLALTQRLNIEGH
ncbi:unnamed protein product [Cyclocybe aegerita]|uniref:Uncharacterized protein n=1 Tax=Cyclocybe aegerita TaxID=1973307 RepID=A0A8S0VUR6_CYCAE|nr:unnamed protein product [Cyclocybe aegerita]